MKILAEKWKMKKEQIIATDEKTREHILTDLVIFGNYQSNRTWKKS